MTRIRSFNFVRISKNFPAVNEISMNLGPRGFFIPAFHRAAPETRNHLRRWSPAGSPVPLKRDFIPRQESGLLRPRGHAGEGWEMMDKPGVFEDVTITDATEYDLIGKGLEG